MVRRTRPQMCNCTSEISTFQVLRFRVRVCDAPRNDALCHELEERAEAISSYPQKYALRLDLRAGTDCEQNTRSAFSWLEDQPLRRPSAATFHCATLSEIMRVDIMAAWLRWAKPAIHH